MQCPVCTTVHVCQPGNGPSYSTFQMGLLFKYGSHRNGRPPAGFPSAQHPFPCLLTDSLFLRGTTSSLTLVYAVQTGVTLLSSPRVGTRLGPNQSEQSVSLAPLAIRGHVTPAGQ